MAQQNVELLSFSIADLNKMKMEFLEAYNSLFNDSYKRLDRALKIKLKAMKYCQEFFEIQQKRFNRRFTYNDGNIKAFDKINISGPAAFSTD